MIHAPSADLEAEVWNPTDCPKRTKIAFSKSARIQSAQQLIPATAQSQPKLGHHIDAGLLAQPRSIANV